MEKRPKTVEDFYHHYPRTNDWAVNFTNIKELPPEQVKQYFSKWGAINNVRQTGQTGTGYCFVHFESEESARNCAIAMKNEFSVRLRPFLDRPRHVPIDKEKETTGLHGEELDFSFKKRDKLEDKSHDSIIREGINEQKINGESSANQPPTADVNLTKTTVNSQQIPICVPKYNGDANPWTLGSNKTNGNPSGTLRKPRLNRSNEESRGSLTTTSKQQHPTSTEMTVNPQKFNGNVQQMSKELDYLCSNSSQIILKYSGSASIPSEEYLQVIQKEIPELLEVSQVLEDTRFITSGASSALALRRPDVVEYVPAEEIVVANIPEFCGIHLILNLFQQYEPICATDIKLINENFIRYCHIYFQTPFHAQAVVNLYDNVEICGKKLIVMRAHRLIEEALSI